MCKYLVPLLSLCAVEAHAFESFVVQDIKLEGLQRITVGTVFNYLERRCAEIAIENGYDYFIIYEDSSNFNENTNKDTPGIDILIDEQRSDKYLLTGQQPIEEDPIQTYIWDRNIKIERTYGSGNKYDGSYNGSFAENKTTNVTGVFKILLTNEIIENFKEYYHPAEKILEKYR